MPPEFGGDLFMVAAIGQAIDTIGEVLALFTKEPTIYFVGLAFATAAAGAARRFIPMKKR